MYDSERPTNVVRTTLFVSVDRNPAGPDFGAIGAVSVPVFENVDIGHTVYTVSASENDGVRMF